MDDSDKYRLGAELKAGSALKAMRRASLAMHPGATSARRLSVASPSRRASILSTHRPSIEEINLADIPVAAGGYPYMADGGKSSLNLTEKGAGEPDEGEDEVEKGSSKERWRFRYEFMTPEDFEEAAEVSACDIWNAFSSITSTHGVPFIAQAKGS